MIRALGILLGSMFLSFSQLTWISSPPVFPVFFLVHAQSGFAPRPWTAIMLRHCGIRVISKNYANHQIIYSRVGFIPCQRTTSPNVTFDCSSILQTSCTSRVHLFITIWDTTISSLLRFDLMESIMPSTLSRPSLNITLTYLQ